MRIRKLEVTNQLIDSGNACASKTCPVALALRGRTGLFPRVGWETDAKGRMIIGFWDSPHKRSVNTVEELMYASEDLRDWIHKFDNRPKSERHMVTPITLKTRVEQGDTILHIAERHRSRWADGIYARHKGGQSQ